MALDHSFGGSRPWIESIIIILLMGYTQDTQVADVFRFGRPWICVNTRHIVRRVLGRPELGSGDSLGLCFGTGPNKERLRSGPMNCKWGGSDGLTLRFKEAKA